MREQVTVMLVDDHEIVRLGLRTLLEDYPWAEVIAEAGTAEEAFRAAEKHLPDVVVMDIRLKESNGITACRTIVAQWPQIKVIMLTSFEDDALIFQAVQAGASGYVLKQVGNRALIDALDAVRRDEARLDPAVALQSVQQARRNADKNYKSAFQGLTHREMLILVNLARGNSNIEIADVLGLSEKTVRNLITVIFAKLGITNRIEAAAYAVRHNVEQHLPGYYPGPG